MDHAVDYKNLSDFFRGRDFGFGDWGGQRYHCSGGRIVGGSLFHAGDDLLSAVEENPIVGPYLGVQLSFAQRGLLIRLADKLEELDCRGVTGDGNLGWKFLLVCCSGGFTADHKHRKSHRN